MKSTLVDANVLIDLYDDDSEWQGWSDAMLTRQARLGPLVVNQIVLAEVAAGLASMDELDDVLPADLVRRESLPWETAYIAARAFVIYRHAGGQRRSPLPDFYIGAHAAVAGHTLLTRDARRYRHYFPKLRIIAP